MAKEAVSALVSVACKLPHGLNLGSGVLLAGTAYDRGSGQKAPELFGGFRITDNIPRKAWDAWMKINREASMVRSGLVFADADRKALVAKAKASRSASHGMEPMGGGQRRSR